MRQPPPAPTVVVLRPYNAETVTRLHRMVGVCLDFMPPFSYVAADESQPCRSGDLCAIKIEGENRNAIKKIVYSQGDWFVMSSHYIFPLYPHEPVAPIVAIAFDLGTPSPRLLEQHAHEVAAYVDFLQELSHDSPKQVSWHGGMIKSLVGTGPVWKP